MTTTATCPLCASTSRRVETLSANLLADLWKRQGFDVKRLLPSSELGRYACAICGLGFYFPFSLGDGQFYGELARQDWYYGHEGKSEYAYVAQLATAGSRIADIGCGIGELMSYLPKGVEFTGIELSVESVNIAQKLGRNVRYLDINDAPEEMHGAFDIVTAFQVLEHVPDVDGFVRSMIRLCKPGGQIIVAVPNNGGFMGKGVNQILNMPPHHVLLWDRRSLLYMASRFNLKVDDYWEEGLARIHRRLYIANRVLSTISQLQGVAHKSIDDGHPFYLRRKLASAISFIAYPFLGGLRVPGHSSILALRNAA